MVRLCTDEDSAVSFWNEADAEEELALDVLDDYHGEAKEVCAAGNPGGGLFPYLVRLCALTPCASRQVHAKGNARRRARRL